MTNSFWFGGGGDVVELPAVEPPYNIEESATADNTTRTFKTNDGVKKGETGEITNVVYNNDNTQTLTVSDGFEPYQALIGNYLQVGDIVTQDASGSLNTSQITSIDFYNIKESVLFDTGDLTRTVSTSNSNTYTVSCWVKRSKLGVICYLFGVNANEGFGFAADSKFITYTSGSTTNTLSGSTFSDTSRWHHVVVSANAGTATVYIDAKTVGTATAPDYMNSCVIGSYNSGGALPFFGYIADFQLIDNQALTPSSFGEFTTAGFWQPKDYTGTYGTKGFHLDFCGSDLGNDVSGQNNDWTQNGIIASSPVAETSTITSVVDVPDQPDYSTVVTKNGNSIQGFNVAAQFDGNDNSNGTFRPGMSNGMNVVPGSIIVKSSLRRYGSNDADNGTYVINGIGTGTPASLSNKAWVDINLSNHTLPLDITKIQTSSGSDVNSSQVSVWEVDGEVLVSNAVRVGNILSFASPNPDLQYFQVGDVVQDNTEWNQDYVWSNDYSGVSDNSAAQAFNNNPDDCAYDNTNTTFAVLGKIVGGDITEWRLPDDQFMRNMGIVSSSTGQTNPLQVRVIYTDLSDEIIGTSSHSSVTTINFTIPAGKTVKTVSFEITETSDGNKVGGLISAKVNGKELVDTGIPGDPGSLTRIVSTDIAANTMNVDGGTWSNGDTISKDAVNGQDYKDTPVTAGTDTGLGGEITGNYATLDPTDGSPTLSNGNLTAAGADAYPTIIPGSGNWYYEVDGTGYTWNGTRANWTPRAGTHNFGQKPFVTQAPAGSKSLCSTNL